MNIMKQFETDFLNSSTYKAGVKEKIDRWHNTIDGKPYGNETNGKSKIVWKLGKKHIKNLTSNLLKPFITDNDIISLDPVTDRDILKSKIDEKVGNFFINKKFKKDRFIKRMIKVLLQEGTVFVRTNWEYIYKEKTAENTPQMAKVAQRMGYMFDKKRNLFVKRNIIENRPTAKLLKNNRVFTDSKSDTFEDSNFLIYEFKTSYMELEGSKLYQTESLAKFKSIIKSETIAFQQTSEYDTNDTMYNYEDDYRKEVVIYEYWVRTKKEKSITVTTIGRFGKENIILKTQKNPLPIFPFVSISLTDEPYEMWGKGLVDDIEDEQKLITGFMRGVINNMAQSINGTTFVRKNTLDSTNYQRLATKRPVVELNNTGNPISQDIFNGNFNQIPQSVFQVMETVNQQADSLTGVTKLMQGLTDQMTNKSATTSQIMLTQSQVTLLDIENSLNNGIRDIMEQWLEMSRHYLDDDEIFKITGINIPEEKTKEAKRIEAEYGIDELDEETKQKAMQLVMEEVNDLFDIETFKYDVKVRVGTDGLRNIKIQHINMFIQQVAPLMNSGVISPEHIRGLIAEFAELLDFPRLGKEIAEYQPQPDPMQQAMQKADVQVKQAQAKKDMALANNTDSRTASNNIKSKKDIIETDISLRGKQADILKTTAETRAISQKPKEIKK